MLEEKIILRLRVKILVRIAVMGKIETEVRKTLETDEADLTGMLTSMTLILNKSIQIKSNFKIKREADVSEIKSLKQFLMKNKLINNL